MVRYNLHYQAYSLDLRTPPPPPQCWQGAGMVIRQSDRIACLPGLMGGGMVLRSN
jgi:hypothetical protein